MSSFRTSCGSRCFCFFFFNDTATTEIYTLSLHDALPILLICTQYLKYLTKHFCVMCFSPHLIIWAQIRSEEHTSELQSRRDLVCRLLLEKKKTQTKQQHTDLTQTNTQNI